MMQFSASQVFLSSGILFFSHPADCQTIIGRYNRCSASRASLNDHIGGFVRERSWGDQCRIVRRAIYKKKPVGARERQTSWQMAAGFICSFGNLALEAGNVRLLLAKQIKPCIVNRQQIVCVVKILVQDTHWEAQEWENGSWKSILES